MCRTIIHNGNRTEWSPIRSVFIRLVNKIGRPRSGGPNCFITSMITDRIERHEVLLPINHNHYNFRENKCIPFFVKELLISSIESACLRIDAKIIPLFVEKTDFFLWNMCFLVERKCCSKSFLQKENDFRKS